MKPALMETKMAANVTVSILLFMVFPLVPFGSESVERWGVGQPLRSQPGSLTSPHLLGGGDATSGEASPSAHLSSKTSFGTCGVAPRTSPFTDRASVFTCEACTDGGERGRIRLAMSRSDSLHFRSG